MHLLKPSSYCILFLSELLMPPETRLTSPTPQYHNIDLRPDQNERCDRLSCLPISLLRPQTELMGSSILSQGTTLLSRGLRNKGVKMGIANSYYSLLHISTSTDKFPWPFCARSRGQKAQLFSTASGGLLSSRV